MVDPGPSAGNLWESLCQEYPAALGGLVGNGFYREQWIEQHRQNVEIFGRPPSLQRVHRFARPIELAARLLACALPPDTVREWVFDTDGNRHSIYALLARNGHPADDLLHLFVFHPIPKPGETIGSIMAERIRQICNELSDTTLAPDPNSACLPLSPADQSVKWPTPEQIENAIGERPDSAIDEINAILSRLDGLFGDPSNPSQSPIMRTLQRHVSYLDTTTVAQIWQAPIDVIRSWARGESSSWGTAVGTNAALRAAERLEQLIAELPNDRRQTLPPNTFADVRQLVTLIGILFPIECELCHEPFFADAPGATWCHACRTGRGKFSQVDVALRDWWQNRNRLLEPLARSTEFNDLRQAIFTRFGVLIGDSGKQWNQSEVDQQREVWERAKLFLRERYKRPSISEDEWRKELLTMPIGEAAVKLGDGLRSFAKAMMGHPGTLADVKAAGPAQPSGDGDWEKLRAAASMNAMNTAADDAPAASASAGPATANGRLPKKSHGKGAARVKIVAGVLAHHRYSNGRCENFEPIRVNDFATAIVVSSGSVSTFLAKAFGDYTGYVGACNQRKTLVTKLTALNGDFEVLKTAGGNPLADQEEYLEEDD